MRALFAVLALALLSGCSASLGPSVSLPGDDVRDVIEAATGRGPKRAVVSVAADDGVNVVTQSTVTIGDPPSAAHQTAEVER